MSAIEAYPTANPEIEAQNKLSQLQRLITIDTVLPDIFSQHSQPSPDITENMKFIQDAVRLAIFWTWQDLADMNSSLASQAHGMMQLSRAYQKGEIQEEVMIGDEIQAKEEIILFLNSKTGINNRNKPVWQHGFPLETDG